jgi:LysR family transcriptional regulator, low CO2-responsive transcriptional regulator
MERLREEKLSIFVAPGHPLAKKNRLDLTDISRLPLIIREGKKGSTRIDELIARLCKQNCKLKVQMRCDSPDSVKAAVTKGAGVGILYHDFVKEDVRRRDFKLVKIRGFDLSATSSVIYSRGKPLSSSAEAFLVLLRDAGTAVCSKKA